MAKNSQRPASVETFFEEGVPAYGVIQTLVVNGANEVVARWHSRSRATIKS